MTKKDSIYKRRVVINISGLNRISETNSYSLAR